MDEESSESVSEELLPPAPASPSSFSEEPEMTPEGNCESESEPDAPPDDKTAHDLEVEAVVPYGGPEAVSYTPLTLPTKRIV